MLFNSDSKSKEEKTVADINRFLNRDKEGKFLPENPGGPGRPKGAIGKYSQIKRDILDVWEEEKGKERFRYFFIHRFEWALAIILSLCPKKWLELKKDLETGQITLEAEEKDAE